MPAVTEWGNEITATELSALIGICSKVVDVLGNCHVRHATSFWQRRRKVATHAALMSTSVRN